MAPLPFELFLALRYLRPKRTSVSIITLISILGVMLGVAVLIVVISVMSGFDREWRSKILGFNAHLEVARRGTLDSIPDWPRVLSLVTNVPKIKGAAPSVIGKVFAEVVFPTGERLNDTPILRGIQPALEPQVSLIPSNIVDGVYDVSNRGALLGIDLAANLQLKVGDRFSVYSPANLRRVRENYDKKKDEAILPEELTVKGLFNVGFADFNALFVITSLETAQDFYELGNAVHGINVVLEDPFDAPRIKQQLLSILGPDYKVITWIERYSELFSTLVLEKNMIFFLLFFIVLVAAFGITSSLITFVVQKTREVGVLKALGATRSQVVWIFLSQGVVVGVIGVTTGLGLGLLALHYRNEFLKFLSDLAGRNLLTTSIYKLYDLPSDLVWSDVMVICGGSLLICTLAGAIPAWTAGRLKPVEALRHE